MPPPDTTDARYRSFPLPGACQECLLARAGLARTFGGLGSFLAVIFLGTGIYLLQESFTDPLRAQAVGLIAGAFIIALATILIYFIFTPRKKFQSEKAHRSHSQTPAHSLVMTPSPLAPPKETAKNLASTIASARIKRHRLITPAESPRNSALPICPGDAAHAPRP